MPVRSTLGLMLAGAWLLPQGGAKAEETGHKQTHKRHHRRQDESDPNAIRNGRHEDVLVTGRARNYQETKPHLDRIMTSLVDTPQSITEIPKQLLADQNVVSMTDALKTVPGISIAAGEGAQQGDNLSIRGFNAQNDFYRDGMLDFGSYYRDPFDMDTVEVLKGPSGAVFGRGSTGGVINEVTKRAEMTPHTDGTLSFGTDGTERLTADVGRGSSMLGGSAFRLNAMVHQAGVANVDFEHTRRYGLAPSVAFGLNGPTRLRLDEFWQQSYDSQSYGLPWLNGVPAPVRRGNYYGYQGDYLKSAVSVSTIRFEQDLGRHVTLHDQIRYSAYNTRQRAVEPQLLGYTPYTNIVPAGVPLSSLQASRNVLALSGPSTLLDNQTEGNADFRTGVLRHRIVFGLEEQRQSSDITRYNYLPRTTTSLLYPAQDVAVPMAPTLRAESGAVSNDLAPYISDTINWGKWELVGAYRWDYYITKYHQFVGAPTSVTRKDKKSTWRASLVYKPTQNSSVYFSYGTSFDPSGENIALTAATAAVAPETSHTYEVGGKWDLARGLSLTAAAYKIDMTNARETDPSNATQVILAGNYRSQGFEISTSGRITPQWSIFGGYSYDDMSVTKSPNRLELGNQPPNAPKHTLALWSEYRFKRLPIEIGAGVNYVSSRTASSLPVAGTTVIERAPGYTTAQLMAKYRINRHISAQVNLANISNETYYAGLHPTHIVVGPGRSALFSVSASY